MFVIRERRPCDFDKLLYTLGPPRAPLLTECRLSKRQTVDDGVRCCLTLVPKAIDDKTRASYCLLRAGRGWTWLVELQGFTKNTKSQLVQAARQSWLRIFHIRTPAITRSAAWAWMAQESMRIQQADDFVALDLALYTNAGPRICLLAQSHPLARPVVASSCLSK